MHCKEMNAARFVVLLAIVTYCFAQECEPSNLEYYTCMLSPTDYYTLHWTLEGNDLHIAMEGRGAEWVGFAFAEEPGQMFPADSVIGWTDVNGPLVLPYRIEATSVFSEDEDFAINLRHVHSEQDLEKTTVYFSRSLKQGRVRLDPKAETDINFATGTTDFLRYHSDNRGSAKIVLAARPKDGSAKEFVPPLLRRESDNAPPEVPPLTRSTQDTQPPAAEPAVLPEETFPFEAAVPSVEEEEFPLDDLF